MSRTTIEVSMKTKKVDEVLNIISEKLMPVGFSEKILDGEDVWMKGDGSIVLMQCVSAVFSENSVILQGWVKDSLLGESNLEGFAGSMPKKKLKGLMLEISRTILSRNL